MIRYILWNDACDDVVDLVEIENREQIPEFIARLTKLFTSNPKAEVELDQVVDGHPHLLGSIVFKTQPMIHGRVLITELSGLLA